MPYSSSVAVRYSHSFGYISKGYVNFFLLPELLIDVQTGSTTPTSQQDGPHETVALTGKRKRGTSVDITPPISSSPPKFAPVDPPAVVHPNDFSHQIPILLFADPKPSSLAQASRERRRPPSPERKTSYIPPGESQSPEFRS